LCKVCARRSTTAAPAGAHQACKAWTRQLQPAGRWLTDSEETLLLGLLDDASATLVLDLVRSSGGRVLAVNTSSTGRRRRRLGPALGRTLVSPPHTPTAAPPKASAACPLAAYLRNKESRA
jgi:hypothetical protein